MEQRRVFSNGEVVIKTDEGIYFHANSVSSMPISIDKEDGEKLFKQVDELEIDTQFTKEAVCPYCGSEQSDSWELDDNDEYYCDECENEYLIQRHTEITYCTSKKQESSKS